jgi:hypothetical protein
MRRVFPTCVIVLLGLGTSVGTPASADFDPICGWCGPNDGPYECVTTPPVPCTGCAVPNCEYFGTVCVLDGTCPPSEDCPA